MSILSAWASGGDAWCFVDTDAVDHTGPGTWQIAKLIPAVHYPAIMAARGNGGFLPTAFCNAMLRVLSFDRLAADLPDILDGTYGDIIAGRAQAGLPHPPEFDNEELVLLGWSSERQAMRLFHYQKAGAESSFTCTAFEDGISYFAPWTAGTPAPLKSAFDLTGMRKLAQAQVRLIRAHSEQTGIRAAAGGRLILAQLSRSRMVVEDLGAIASGG